MHLPTGAPIDPLTKAVIASIADGLEPEAFLSIDQRYADGGGRHFYAWTNGGEQLGDTVDSVASVLGLDGADGIHLGELHHRVVERGRVRTYVHPLRPILADIQRGVRAPEGLRGRVERFREDVRADLGDDYVRRVPGVWAWFGFGPTTVAHSLARSR